MKGDGDDGVSKSVMCGCGSAITTDLSCGVAECTAPFRSEGWVVGCPDVLCSHCPIA